MQRPTIVATVGTRPEAIKLAPVIRALAAEPWCETRVLATGQHRAMLDAVLGLYEVRVDIDLDLMRSGQTLAGLTARMIPAVDAALDAEQPDFVVALGDTTTVLVTALCCFYRRVPFAHVEAGLRTRQRGSPFPEETNRQMVARLAAVHYAPTATAARNLHAEGIPPGDVIVTGNTGIDALLWAKERAGPSVHAARPGRRLVLVTAHRREHLGKPLQRICDAVRALADRGDIDVLYPVHPNPEVRNAVARTLEGHAAIRLTDPLDYPEFIAAMRESCLILTDSGGVQEEAPALGIPTLVLREETERPEALAAGTSHLAGTDSAAIVDAARRILDDDATWRSMARPALPFGDGHAAARIVASLRTLLLV